MNRAQHEREKYLRSENLKWPKELRCVPESEWPVHINDLWQVWRSREFLVQLFSNQYGGIIRMSVNRTSMASNGRWSDQITWDELQRLKRECGYGDYDAVEVYPADRDIVNVANMRHLWIMQAPLPFAWRSK